MAPIHADGRDLSKNPSLICDPDNTVYVKESPIRIVGKGQVKIHIKCTGICGSDIHFWKKGRIGELIVDKPMILGHETAGQILEVGEGVKNVKVGDKVAVEPQVPCGTCYLCMQGDYNLCSDVDFLGVPPTNGSMQRYLVTDARFVFKLPDSMTYEQGALVEPLSVGYHGVERSSVTLGLGAVIAGAGPIGLATLLLAKARGATPIVITDLSPKRLDFARKIVPDVITYQVDTKISDVENAKKIRKLFGDDEVSQPVAALECTGVASSIITLGYVVRRAGTLTVLGVAGRNEIDGFPFMHLSLAEIDVKFINRYHHSWPPVISLISSGRINVDKFVTHRFALEEAPKAFECSSDPSNGNIKVVILDDVELL